MNLSIYVILLVFIKNAQSSCTHGEIVQEPLDVSCRSFYLCAHGHQMLMTCAPGTMFDTTTLSCNHSTMVSCSTIAASTMKNACERNFGVFQNPVDPTCSTFIQCSWSEPYVRDCNPGYLFNPETKKCDFPSNVQCTVRAPKLNEEDKKKLVLNPSPVEKPKNLPKIYCFYPNYAYWRKALGKFTPDDIDAKSCTHLVYAYIVLDPQKLSIKSSDAWLDIEKGNYNSFTNLKNDNPNVKMIISLGGWVESNDNREAYNLVFNNDRARETFLQSLLAFLDEWKFDGLDLSFEFPQINERQGFTTWVKSIKEAFGDRFELSASIPANTKKLQEGYEIQELNKYLDSFLVMAYDLHGPWESSADHHAPLFRRQWDTTYNYIDATIQNLMDHGAMADKVVLGIPTYGRSWSVKDPKWWRNMQPPLSAKGAAPGGFITKASGSMGYMEICLKVKNAGWEEIDDPEGPYSYSKNKTIWVGYDTPGSAADKANYALARGLGGVMIWDLTQDDFGNACGRGKFPILRAVHKVLSHGQPQYR